MANAAMDHAVDQGDAGLLGHVGPDGSKPHERLARYGDVPGMSGEGIAYGKMDPVEVVLHLAIDDGIKSRCHRANIFNPVLRRFACFTNYHKAYQRVTVCTYAETFTIHEVADVQKKVTQVEIDKWLKGLKEAE